MKRKIIKLGQATYVTSLPSKWVRKYDLKQGDYLDVEEKENTLSMSTVQRLESRTVVISLPSKELFLKRLIYLPYRLGYDEVKFIYKDPDLIHKIIEASSILIGFEIVEQGEHFCVFRNMSTSFEDEFENMFRRVFYTIETLLSEMLEALEKKQYTRLKNFGEREEIVNRLVCFCERVINKRGTQNFTDNSFAYITVWTLEQIGDELKQMVALLSTSKNISLITKKNIEQTLKLFQLFSRLYFKPGLEESITLKKSYHTLKEEIRENLEKNVQKEIQVSYHLLACIDKINSIALSIPLRTKDLEKS